ncbi:hypothetical protein NEOLEDRAFT_1127707 [Neolentinus lepideus HHB14362 ss-1]|uniref:Velvet domain-containing protein n=1 Tax=Neolentinus lepideus HHB14362 ss-1 TaxID=1314782 RepID=A0A165VL54_9AGAM|nr:hypothetical protein NEOLEDRAFT_1127707 [Neolentinus lepideus HHB14362 ss-1]
MFHHRAPESSRPRYTVPGPAAFSDPTHGSVAELGGHGHQQRMSYQPGPSTAQHRAPPEPTRRLPRSPDADLVRGAQLPGGQFASQGLRPGLVELQRPKLGRKYAVKDRRPLDPPPIVKLQAYRTVETRRGWEEEKLVEDYTSFHELGLICYVDLFEVPEMSDHSTVPVRSPDDPDIVARLDDFVIRESNKRTVAMAGETFVQAARLEHRGNIVLFFIFPDISVRTEGIFILRYRFFDIEIFAPGEIHPTEGLPVLAETYGGTFEIYSTKDFPGLPESTELTKHVAKYNIRVNVRESRRTRNRGQDESESRHSN